MIKQITVAECDICGKTQKAVLRGTQRDEYYGLPNGWYHSKVNDQLCFCETCWSKLIPQAEEETE